MNSTITALLPLLEFLWDFMPPSHVTLVGAGNGKGAWAQWLNTQAAPMTLVEADEQRFATLQSVQASGSFAHASLLHAVVAVEAGEATFHSYNLAEESGLLPIEDVLQLWPNVHTLQANELHATTLAELISPQHANQWLVLDCLPAAALMQKVTPALAHVDVVVARVLRAENKAYQILGADLAELVGLLPDFSQLALQPSLHPDIAYVLLVRDYRSSAAQALKALMAEREAKQAAIQAQQVLQAQLQQAQQENAALLKKRDLLAQAQQALEADFARITQTHAAECQAKQAVIQTQKMLQAQLDQAQQENADFCKERELLAQTQKILEADLAKITQAHAAEGQAKQAAIQTQKVLQAQLLQAQQENAALLKKEEPQVKLQQALQADLTKIAQSRDAEAQAKKTALQAQQELQTRLDKVQAERSAAIQRQQLLQEECFKAEVQLSLLKELFLRDKATRHE